MTKPLVVFACFLVGLLLMAIAILGMMGIWQNFLFFSLEPLRTSWQWPVGLLVAGGMAWFFGRLVLSSG